jgi:uncharacterized repeat protein (TIGR03803 family)
MALTFAALVLTATLSAQTEKVLHSFTGQIDGKYPYGGLIFDPAGNLYGTTYGGGNTGSCSGYGCGTAFRLAPTPGGRWQENVLRGFNGVSDGAYILGGLTQDASGNLYGTTMEAAGRGCCGTVYELSPTSSGAWKETILYTFSGGADGGTPMQGRVLLDSAGNLYGATPFGGNNAASCGNSFGSGCGVIFELSPTSSGSWTETVLHAFTGGDDGAQPATQLVFDEAGNIYGTTSGGGASLRGVAFELSRATSDEWQETVLHAFGSIPDGENPGSGEELVFDGAGNLYGATSGGGAYGYGAVFELSPTASGTWTEAVLYSFAGGHDGKNPNAGVVFDAAGNLYGATIYGGILFPSKAPKSAPGCGVVYKVAPASGGAWTETVVHHFTCGGDGGNPSSALIVDTSGNLYGTTTDGGRYNSGVVYEVIP